MPYRIIKRGKKFVVINMETGDVKGMHDSKMMARKQMGIMMKVTRGEKGIGKK